jgi:hypothetical protein
MAERGAVSCERAYIPLAPSLVFRNDLPPSTPREEDEQEAAVEEDE